MSIQSSAGTARAFLSMSCAVVVLISFGVAQGADTRIVGVAGSNSNTVLTREVVDLQARVKKLERALSDIQRALKKPDEPDSDDSDKPDKPDKQSGSGKDSSGNAGAKDASSSTGGKPDSASHDGDENLKEVFPAMTLRAPFIVVDSAGKAIFRVNDPHAKGGSSGGERGAYIYGDAGTANTSLIAFSGGGRVIAQNDKANLSSALNVVADNAGVKVVKDKRVQTYMGLVDGAKPFVAVFSADDNAAAGLQLADSGKGLVAVFNGQSPVAFLSQSVAHPGGGNVTATDPGGSGVFSAGYTGEGGDACVNRKQGTRCVGAGSLPLGIGQ